MPRTIKFQDETIFPKPNYWGKILMYNNPSWNILYPIVDIIRLLPKTTIITYKYGKNQDNIRLYGSQYNHSAVGTDLNVRSDYIESLKCVKFVFIFSDTQDSFAENLIKYCEKSRTNLICYSSLDSIYHFYEYLETDKIIHKIEKPLQVIEKMQEIKERGTVNKLQELFPEFEIIERQEIKKISTLENCLIILKNTQQSEPKRLSTRLPFDPNFNKLKKLEDSKKRVVYDDELPVHKPLPSTKNLLANFFKKRG